MSDQVIEEVLFEEENSLSSKDTVSISDVLARLLVYKYILLIWIAIGAILGIVISFGLPKTYTSTLAIVPESTEASTGTSAALAALGMNNGVTTEDAYNPSIYPDIVSSIPFVVGLLEVPVQTSESDTTYTLRDYMEFHTISPWWSELIGRLLPKDDEQEVANEIIDPFRLTKPEAALCKAVSNAISVNVDKVTAQMTISVTLQDALVAAQLTDTVGARLQEYITDYRTAKSRNDLDHALTINAEAQQQYYEAQQAYAEYMDRNQGLAFYSAQTTRDRLQNEMQLAFNLYNQTSQRVQQCEAKVQEQTPVFAIVSPSTVAIRPSGPRKILITALFVILFTLIGAIWISFPLFFSQSFKNKVMHQMEEKQESRKRHRLFRFHKRSGSETQEAADLDAGIVESVENEGWSADNYSLEDGDNSRFAPQDSEENVTED